MKQFHFTADITFEAINLYDAFDELVRHFTGLRDGDDDMKLEFRGEMAIDPVIEKKG